MYLYIAKRVLSFIPAILLVVLFSFLLLHFSPGDPVERMFNVQSAGNEETFARPEAERLKSELRKKLGLDLPLFYFSLSGMQEMHTHSDNKSWKKYIPAIQFNKKNQFHRWIFGDGEWTKGIINGDLGISYASRENVSSIISKRLPWSVLLTLLSVIFAYLISIPAGLLTASRPESVFSKWITTSFIILFSLPSFWIATLLMLSFCNPGILNILPSSGVGPPEGFSGSASFTEIIIGTIPYLILPTICYTYSSLAFLSGTVKTTIEDILQEDYIRTARAKGLSEKTVLTKHALRNALLPLIIIFTHVFPLAIGGSVILETIFSIPGMGQAVYNSIDSQDYPVIISVFMITGICTMTAFLLGDILCAIADPRITFTGKRMAS